MIALEPIAVAWLLTYAVHSTVLLGLGRLVLRSRSRLAPITRETLGRTALFGALLTTTLQVGLDARLHGIGLPWPGFLVAGIEASTPNGPGIVTGAVREAPPNAVRIPREGRSTGASDPRTGLRALAGNPALERERPAAAASSSAQPAALERTRQPDPRRSFGGLAAILREHAATLAVLAWLAGCTLLAALSLGAGRRLRRRLSGRQTLADGPALDLLRRLVDRAGQRRNVRLTVSDGVSVPVAFGVLRPEICLPRRAVSELDGPQQEAMLAHELGHLVRRDPLWLAAGRWLQTLFFFQPLHRGLLRQLREVAEEACDEQAIHLTGDRLALASCLAEVAGWGIGRPSDSALAAMADRPSGLRRRLERLLEPNAMQRRHAGAGPLLGAALLLAGLAVPGFSRPAAPETAADVTLDHPDATAPSAPAADPVRIAMTGLLADLDALGLEIATLRHELDGSSQDEELLRTLHQLAAREASLRDALRRLGRWLEAPLAGATPPATSPPLSVNESRMRR